MTYDNALSTVHGQLISYRKEAYCGELVIIEEIQDKIGKGEYRFSDHAVKRMISRFINRFEVENVIMTGQVIEEYHDDKYSPSCLIYGKTKEGRDLRVQISLPPSVVVVTTYEPDPSEWIDFKIRRKIE